MVFSATSKCTWGSLSCSLDGTSSNSSDPVVEGPYLYDLLSAVDNSKRRYLFDFQFDPRPLRLLMWRSFDRINSTARSSYSYFTARGNSLRSNWNQTTYFSGRT